MSNGKWKNGMGAPAKTYIEECNFERKLERSISDESNAKPFSWGQLLERRVGNLCRPGETFTDGTATRGMTRA